MKAIINGLTLAVVLIAAGYALLPFYPHVPSGSFQPIASVNSSNSATLEHFPVNLVFSTNSSSPIQLQHPKPFHDITVGEPVYSFITLENTSTKAVSFELHSHVWPGIANFHVHKLNCHCYQQLHLAPFASMQLPISFVLSPGLPQHVQPIQLYFAIHTTTHINE